MGGKRSGHRNSLPRAPGPVAEAVKGSADVAGRAAAGLWRRDPSVWSADATVQKAIADRLGWMSSPVLMAESVDRLRTFAVRVKSGAVTDVVLPGMGGSMLIREVLRASLGFAT